MRTEDPDEFVETGRACRRRKDDVEITGRTGQVQHGHRRQRCGVVGEGEPFVEVVHPDAGMQLLEGRRQSVQVVPVPAGCDVDVVGGLERSALGDRGEGSDDDVVDPVTIEHGQDVLGRKLGSVHPFLALAANLVTLR